MYFIHTSQICHSRGKSAVIENACATPLAIIRIYVHVCMETFCFMFGIKVHETERVIGGFAARSLETFAEHKPLEPLIILDR